MAYKLNMTGNILQNFLNQNFALSDDVNRITNNIEEINNKIDDFQNIKIDLLWTNPNPNSALEETIIKGNFDNYTFFLVQLKWSNASTNDRKMALATFNDLNNNKCYIVEGQSDGEVARKLYKVDTGLKIGTVDSTLNCIFLKIYGVKI